MTETGTGTGTTGTPPANTAWYAGPGFDDLPDASRTELTGYLQNRGWDKTDARAAALGAIKAHREAERLIGAPADKMVRLPKDAADEPGWNELRTKLGVPAKPEDYNFSDVKFSDGKGLDADFTAKMSAALRDANVSLDRAPAVAKAMVEYFEKAEAAETAEKAASVAQEKDALRANWGQHFNANMLVAQNAATKLGVDAAAIAALEGAVGYAKVMEMMRNIGSRMGEDSFVMSRAPGGNGPMSAEQATATLAERKNDKAWTTKLMNGDMEVRREFDTLSRLMQPA
jgi:hypothetical protein